MSEVFPLSSLNFLITSSTLPIFDYKLCACCEVLKPHFLIPSHAPPPPGPKGKACIVGSMAAALAVYFHVNLSFNDIFLS
jgi:hypothetical protein